MGLLRRILDTNKRVQEAACSAFATLEEVFFFFLPCTRYLYQTPNRLFYSLQKEVWWGDWLFYGKNIIMTLEIVLYIYLLLCFNLFCNMHNRRQLRSWSHAWKSFYNIFYLHMWNIRFKLKSCCRFLEQISTCIFLDRTCLFPSFFDFLFCTLLCFLLM